MHTKDKLDSPGSTVTVNEIADRMVIGAKAPAEIALSRTFHGGNYFKPHMIMQPTIWPI